jgi:capsid protein
MAMIELERNMLLTMPGGWKMGQLDPKQPSTTYAEFVEQIINEIVRCLLMPLILARGSSARSNFSSARLDTLVYGRALRVDQSFIASVILDRILYQWIREFYLLFPSVDKITRLSLPPHAWIWDTPCYNIDPLKEARAQEIRLKYNLTTLANEFSVRGRDWESELVQRSREKRLMQKLRLTDEDVIPTQNNPDEREEEDDDDDE